MRREARFVIAILLGALVAFVSTLPLWRDVKEPLENFLLCLSLPGAIVALPLGAVGMIGNAHDPNTIVMVVVDGLFYSWLCYWLMTRRLARGH